MELNFYATLHGDMSHFATLQRYVQHCRVISTALQKDICNIARRYIKHHIEICDYIVAASGRAELLDKNIRQHSDTFASL